MNFIFSESYHVEISIEQKWLKWMETEFIPNILNFHKLDKLVFTKVISHPDPTGNTYSLQYYLKEESKDMQQFKVDHLKIFSTLIANKFGLQVLVFQTELEIIKLFN